MASACGRKATLEEAPVRRPDGVTATIVSCWDGAEVASVSQCQCPSDHGLMKCSGWGGGGGWWGWPRLER